MAAKKKAAARKVRGRPFAKGNAGRPKGAKNKATGRRFALERLEAAGIQPIDVLAAELTLAQKEGDRETVIHVAGMLLPYCYPKLKSVDMRVADPDGEKLTGITVTFVNGNGSGR